VPEYRDHVGDGREGKTTSVANFGIVCAQAGSRVCMVDSDLRRPALHQLFGLENDRGLTTALVEELPFAEVAQRTHIPNLWLLRAGVMPTQSCGAGGVPAMRELLEAASSTLIWSVCDSPR